MLPERKRSTLAVADNALMVVGAVLVGLLALKLLGWIVGTVLFLVKVALAALVVAFVARMVLGRRRDDY